MAARTRRIFHDENTRNKIQTTQLIKRLTKHILAEPKKNADGEVETVGLMTQSQVTAALGLIKKTLPDLTAVEHSGEISTPHANELTEQQIIQRLAEIETGETALNGAIEDKAGKKELH